MTVAQFFRSRQMSFWWIVQDSRFESDRRLKKGHVTKPLFYNLASLGSEHHVCFRRNPNYVIKQSSTKTFAWN